MLTTLQASTVIPAKLNVVVKGGGVDRWRGGQERGGQEKEWTGEGVGRRRGGQVEGWAGSPSVKSPLHSLLSLA